MAKGQVVVAQLQTPSPALKFPIADTNDLLGGRHSVATINDRNNIPAQRRRVGMTVYVEADGKEYQLLPTNPATGNTTNAHWKEYAPGVPSNMITEHQKVEDMRYTTAVNRRPTSGVSTPTPTDKLTEVLENLQAQIDDKLSTHQTLEDIQIANPSVLTGGYSTLLSKLQSMDSAIASLTSSATQGIEDISWNTAPAGHQTTLEDEINYLYSNMNDPTKIMVDSGSATLQKKLNDLTAYRPTIEEIKSAGGQNLSDVFVTGSGALMLNADKINVNNASGLTPASVSLNARLQALDAKAGGLPKMTDIEWATGTNPSFTPYGGTAAAVGAKLSQNLIQIYGALEHMNDPTQIVTGVTASGKTVIEDLTALNTAISSASASGKVESITWNAADATAGAAAGDSLKTTIDKIFGDMNDPTKITTGLYANGNKLNTDLTALKNAIEGITLTSDKITHAGAFSRINASDTKLSSILKAIDDAIGAAAGVPNLDDLSWGSSFSPTSTFTNFNITANMTLEQTLAAIDSAIASASAVKVAGVTWDSTAPSGFNAITVAANESLETTLESIDAMLASHSTSLTTINSVMNKPGNINTGIMDASHTNTLLDDLTALKTAISSASGTVEDTTWSAAPSPALAGGVTNPAANSSLKDTIVSICTELAKAKTVAETKWDAAYTGTNFNAAVNEALSATMASIDNAIGAAAGKSSVEQTKWAAAPSTAFTNFTTPAANETLATTLANIDTAIGNAAATAQAAGAQKQNLLFNVNAPENGVIACEYLTMFKAKIEEIAYYVNSDATKASDIKFYVEVAKVQSGQTNPATYVNLLEGAAAADPGTGTPLGGTLTGATLVQIDDKASNNYILDENTLIRLRIVTIGSSDTINAFNVRVKLVECASTVTDEMKTNSSAITNAS